ncbi:PilZ domain-containing protein [Halalkalibacterium ligniniphilum]|uniref:PilZ domain-containing protein n=1 Tax=Halalkalibacterium ligniniphilum TaxID=1134413 RepID=UPI000348D5FC|nr:PilZ domain-containing protein [Halalkalibacterium ligniniphilum]
MPFRREDAFRYTFEDPLKSTFRLIKADEKNIRSSEGEMCILDISPGGIRMSTTYELPDPEETSLFLEIDLPINEAALVMRGEVVWKKSYASSFEYGINFHNTEKERQMIVAELKIYVKRHLKLGK